MTKKKKLLMVALLGIFIVIFAVCAGILIKDYHIKKVASSSMEELKHTMVKDSPNKVINEANSNNALEVEIPNKNVDFASLQAGNKDVYAWIYIPGTEVDYPVLQHESDDEYYVSHNYDGSEGRPGVIYSEPSVTSRDFTDFNTVLYGHNMKDATMFSTLHRFADREFFDANRYVYIYTPEKVFIYKIYAAYTYSDIHPLKGIDISTKELFQKYLDTIVQLKGMNNNFADDVKVTSDNHILTLLTCTNEYDDHRYLVQAVLINE